MTIEPFLLLRDAEAYQEQLGSAFPDVFDDPFLFFFVEVAVMAAHESDLPMGLLETIGRLLRDAGRTAQEIDGPAFFRCDL